MGYGLLAAAIVGGGGRDDGHEVQRGVQQALALADHRRRLPPSPSPCSRRPSRRCPSAPPTPSGPGIGTAAVAAIGIIFLGESAGLAKIAGIVLVIAGSSCSTSEARIDGPALRPRAAPADHRRRDPGGGRARGSADSATARSRRRPTCRSVRRRTTSRSTNCWSRRCAGATRTSPAVAGERRPPTRGPSRRELTRLLEEWFAGGPDGVELEYELYLAALRRPALRPVAAEWADGLAGLVAGARTRPPRGRSSRCWTASPPGPAHRG